MSIIINKLLVTEKSSLMQQKNVFVFLVDKTVNKIVLKKLIETEFKVSVIAIRTCITKAKKRKQKYKGFTKTFKKAYVTLKQGDKIDSAKDK